ncbi:MAG: hypothetical protein WD649_05425 [Thermoleophilaceae bacterium]
MGTARYPLRRIRREEAGVTLIELMVVSAVGVLLFGVGLALYSVATRNEAKTGARSENLQQAQTAMERMTRELRQGSAIVSSSPTEITFETYVRGVGNQRVRFSCSGSACSRAVAPSGTNSFGSPVTLVSSVDPNVFTVAGGQVKLRLRLTRTSQPNVGAGREVSAELNDGVTLRNSP